MSSIIKGVLKEEYERLKRLIQAYKKEIQKYPKGSISIKQKRERFYAYLAYWKNGSAHFKYLGPASAAKVKKIEQQIKDRRKCESLLKEAKIYFKEVSKVTHGHQI